MLEDILVPLGICVVMPVMIVWLVFRSRNHTLDRKTEVMIKAIENGQEVDPSLFSSVSADAKASKTLKMQLMSKLQGGIITLLIGLTLLVVGLCGIDAARHRHDHHVRRGKEVDGFGDRGRGEERFGQGVTSISVSESGQGAVYKDGGTGAGVSAQIPARPVRRGLVQGG